MDIHEFKRCLEESGSKDLVLGLQESTQQSRRLNHNNFIFFDTTIQYLNTMISASIGKYSSLGGKVADDAFNVRMIGRALDEDIFFPGIFLHWASTINYPIKELEIDIRPVPTEAKDSKGYDVKMADVGAKADAIYFLESYENSKELIEKKFGKGWFRNWPAIFRFAYILRNALAHNGRWGLEERSSRSHYQYEKFDWPRCGLTIQMRDFEGNPVDEGREALKDLNGVDFVVLLIEMNEALNS